ncbi:uncharacterized protein PV07_02001 [Cladophialophora immunda]|uniref:EthD domain-containing protein n=1 Tax=Cladophialophora immunda TaxID=569365 RepID=A0A0D2CW15_9EURO|nr:uncharacterized protein PV07_02001 [Cladophialophora immunda]KIW35298.1 hypothetical protein PV07_02001 [Cladophialophora immunda]
MSSAAVKWICLVKRKPGLSKAEFKDYYENNHVPMVNGLIPHVERYIRNYTVGEGSTFSPAWDCITEFWFTTEQDWTNFNQCLSEPNISKKVAADEEKFVDRSATQATLVKELGGLVKG